VIGLFCLDSKSGHPPKSRRSRFNLETPFDVTQINAYKKSAAVFVIKCEERGMDSRKLYRQDGYRKGFDDGRRTEGKLNKVYINNLLKNETQSLSSENSMAFIKGWQEGFTEAVSGIVSNLMVKEFFFDESTCEDESIYEIALN
jgi:hypothetical protein